MKVESAELQLTEDNNEFFSGSFLSEQGWGTGRNKGKAVGPLDSDVPEAPLPSISHTGRGTQDGVHASGVGAGSLV